MPYKFIEGVFVKQNYNHNAFPVYKRENDNLLFYLKVDTTGKVLIFGLNLNNYFGVGARLVSYVEPSTWLATGTLNRNEVFDGLVSYWMYWNARDLTNYRVDTPPIIKAICVDEDFRECNSDRVYLNSDFTDGKGNDINKADTDYFKREPNTFRNLRPVYKHSSQAWYLQYTSDDYWLVTSTRYPSNYNDRGALMRVNDLALRPEYIDNTWQVHHKGWRLMQSLKVKCRGLRSQADICSINPCTNGATCVYTSGNETLCVCAPGYYGLRCSNSKKCPTPQGFPDTETGFGYPGNIPGYLAMTFCRGSYPSMRYAICSRDGYSDNPHWVRQGTACRGALTTAIPATFPPRTAYPIPFQPTPKPINFDDIRGLTPAVLTCAVLLQILLPFVLWCCACCKKSCKEVDEDEEDQRRLEEFGGELESRLANVQNAQSQEELDQGVQNYRHAVEEYQRETEETQLERKKGFYRNASILRLISMDLYISFYLWLIYYVGCKASESTKYGSIFGDLQIMAIVMLILCPLVVLIESVFSHELAYIKNIMHDETAWSYIQRMHAVAPIISMTVECYHWETRTRVVYYTDANGNSQSRTETYQERVVTFVDSDVFSFGCWVDVSKREMPSISYVALTRLKIDAHINFGDQETEEDYGRQREDMLDRNRHRDVHMDFSTSREIPGLEQRISAYVDLSVKPWWIGQGYFWIATLLMLTWPYRWLFRAKTAKSYYDLNKKIYKSTTPPREVDIMDPITILQQPSVPVMVESNVNPSFCMSEIPSTAPPQQLYPTSTVPPAGLNPAYLPTNQEPVYPPPNQVPAYYPPNQVPAYYPPNQVPAYYPPNQVPAYLPTNQGSAVPNAPPPSYDDAVGQCPPYQYSTSAPLT
ncbi:hypothetical protein QZH41_005686 [Actinostola sp. cb2023]|nr:hypothetical protein QZH41_005686 [Actinostola sp. cb2023]